MKTGQTVNVSAQENPADSDSHPRPAVASPSLDMKFLHRTAWATVLTIMLVSALAAAYYDATWALRYSLIGFWAIGFFALTALIFKNLLFDGNTARGILFTVLKFASLGLIFVVNFYLWPVTDAEGNSLPGHALALTLGLITPFFVFVLRLMGFLLEAQKSGGKVSLTGMLPAAPVVGAKNSAARMK